MIRFNLKRIIYKINIVAYVLFSLYYSYRYILQYNSSLTSSTYLDTPYEFQVGKYFLALIITISNIIGVILYRKVLKDEVYINTLVVMSLFLAVLNEDHILFFKCYLFMFLGISYSHFYNKCTIKDLYNTNRMLLIYHFSYSLVQILLYFTLGKLPALAEKGKLVRFGGGFDDPNAFAMYLLIPIAYLIHNLYYENKLKKWINLVVCLLLEVITFSFSGYLGLLIVFSILIYHKRMYIKTWRVCTSLLIGNIFLIGVFYNSIQKIILYKTESFQQHLEMLSISSIETTSLAELVMGTKQFVFSENMYFLLIGKSGLLITFNYILINILVVIKAYRIYKYNRNNSLFFAGFSFLVAFNVCQFAIPYSYVFPINYIYWVIAGIVLQEYRLQKIGIFIS